MWVISLLRCGLCYYLRISELGSDGIIWAHGWFRIDIVCSAMFLKNLLRYSAIFSWSLMSSLCIYQMLGAGASYPLLNFSLN